MDLTQVFLLLLPFALLAAALGVLRWARRRSNELKGAVVDAEYNNFPQAVRERQYRKAAKLYFVGSLPPAQERIAHALAIGVIVAVSCVLALVAFALLNAT